MTGAAAAARVIVGVTAGIAAYKAASLVRLFTESGHDVTVVPTASSLRFVGAPTWEALTGHPVATDVWTDVPAVTHVRLGQSADLIVVAPATADLLSRAATGRADDLLTTTLLMARCPVVVAPAMHTEMWQHPATQANVSVLRERGITVIDPAVGRLTGPDSGPGRLPDPSAIFEACTDLLTARGDLSGRSVLISAGGTREPIDPVRFLGNRSSGRQGYALAEAAARRGAEVTLVAANVALADPPGVTVVPVETAAELEQAMTSRAAAADVIVMCAAVADFRPAAVSSTKVKKGSTSEPQAIALERTADVLRSLTEQRRTGQVIVGFAAETGDAEADVMTHARAKLAAKGCDLLVVNDVSRGDVFAAETNEVVIVSMSGADVTVPRTTKSAVAGSVWDEVVALLP